MSVDRREFLQRATLTTTGAAIMAHELQNAAVASAARALEGLASRELDSEQSFYFTETGHHLSGGFLNFWRTNRNGAIFGLPITEVMEDDDGWTIQYLENVRLEQNPETNEIQLGAIGTEIYENLGQRARARRPLRLFFASLAKKYPTDLGGAIYDVVPGEMNPYLPAPNEGGVFEYTERALLFNDFDNTMPPLYNRERLAKGLSTLWPGEVKLWPFAKMYAEMNGIDTSGVSQQKGTLRYSPNMFDSQKRVEVRIGQKILMAFEGDFMVLSAPVVTGMPGYETPTGNFRIGWKPEFLDYNSPFPEAHYFVAQVPFNMEFAPMNFIHGAYWHNGFEKNSDYPGSYGCVNVDMYDAKWLFDWTRFRTPVRITI